ncbi:hypothetical protein, partial [Klebsiella variicola]|uniref:hypothetical protein n=1 Tax=Klebsiella variicola TaxID=244366 RepID=UPI001954368E
MSEQQGRRGPMGQSLRRVEAELQRLPVASDHGVFDHMCYRLGRALQLWQRVLADRAQFAQVLR